MLSGCDTLGIHVCSSNVSKHAADVGMPVDSVVKIGSDEATSPRVGEGNQQDYTIVSVHGATVSTPVQTAAPGEHSSNSGDCLML